MNLFENLILVKGKNLTADIKFCQYNNEIKKYEITFLSGKNYRYNPEYIEWLQEPEALDANLLEVRYKQKKLANIQDIKVFHASIDDYWYICFSNGDEKTYKYNDLEITHTCLDDKKTSNCLSYFSEIAAINELKNEAGEVLLQKQYEKLNFIDRDSVLAVYLNPHKYVIKQNNVKNPIFPFGGNASQFKAVAAALNEQASVIQGPPGTGKTQTILNIIANLLIANKTIQVVSNNNSATANVLEKLASSKYNMSFLVASLGNAENKKQFIKEQTGTYPDFSSWEMNKSRQEEIWQRIQNLINQVKETFDKQERLAQKKIEIERLQLEMKYFQQYCKESELAIPAVKSKRMIKSDILLKLWQECYEFSEKECSVSLWFRIKSYFFYRIGSWKFYKNGVQDVINLLQDRFYKTKENEIIREITMLEESLSGMNATGKMDELSSLSLKYLQAILFDRYGNNVQREIFLDEDLWKRPEDIVEEYPIILSTTFSSRNCLQGVMYDYIIMDEASQVDIVTGALALSKAKNAVIVGDLKQLPNVITKAMQDKSAQIFNSYNLDEGYSYLVNSFLKSVCSVIPNLKQTLLREHYRCHPKIIGFCNQKFYNDELVIMTEDHHEKDVLYVIKTASGKHCREHINQRQIDVVTKEALTKLEEPAKHIGIIAPYKDQVAKLTKEVNNQEIEIHTVHKFQGKEKNTILLTTVDDVVTDFSDDPYLLNVAVSRAKDRLWVITSGNEQPVDSNIGDLIDYIEYNNFRIDESEIYSVFDLLYKEYTAKRIEFLKGHLQISKYDSENLMYATIVDILNNKREHSLDVICHQPLKMLIRNTDRLNKQEIKYVMNRCTHLDFLIYNKISKKPILAIEVDGFHYHKPGTEQYRRDRMKDHILELYGIPLKRFSTTGSGESEIISSLIDVYLESKKPIK